MSASRCLIIDPDPQFAYILSGIISRHGIDVAITGNPFGALRMLRMEPYDLVVYDVSSEHVDHELMLQTLQRDLPAVLARTVLVSRTPFESNRIPAGVPMVGKHDLQPLMDYLSRK